ncbi:MAG TPA: LuxR C-terminal-related transcriptional regulator [Streptosporangiaceae bacterium]
MAEPPAGDPAAISGRTDGLLATKLHIPRQQPGFVTRPRLAEQLADGLTRGVVLVCAPAGFGKTSLLADWARSGRRPVAWLSLDVGDNDPARFWRHVVAALDQRRPGLADQVAPLLDRSGPVSYEGLVTTLINHLAAQPVDGETILILDDYHEVKAPPVHTSLEFLLAHRPPGLRLVLAGRADPPLALARLRARGQLVELRAAQLRFTAAEAAGLLRAAVGPDLPEDAVAALTARTEGWVAGLQLAGLSLRGQADVGGFVASFSGSHRFVLDFLAEEVLDRQSPEVRTFLLETSVLDRLSGELCDAVTGRNGAQAMLERVERANLFLVPLDEVRGWWRYHHLFADLLRARLRQQQPERVRELHHNAAAWCEVHGPSDDAVRHALAAGDPAWAARLVERHADELLTRSERATLARWLAALPAEVVEVRPRLLLAQALSALVGGRTEEVGGLLDGAERALAGTVRDEPFEPSVGRAGSLLANVPALMALERAFLAELYGDAERQAAFGRQALAEAGPGDRTLSTIIGGHLGVAEWVSGRLPEAARTLESSIVRLHAIGERFLAVRVSEHLGQVQRALADLDGALETYRRALEIAAPSGQPAMPAVGVAYVGMAEVAYQRDELDAALRQLTDGIAPSRQLIFTQPAATGLATLAWVRQARGDTGAARDAIEEAARIAPGENVASLLNPVLAQRARLLLAQGDVSAAARWIEQRGLRADDEPSYPREPAYLVLARVLIAQDRPGQALGLLDRLHALATAQRRPGSLIEIKVLQALALAARGDEAAAPAALTAALELACPRRYVRVFADEGPPLAALLGKLLPAQRSEPTLPYDYLARLARTFERDAAAAGQLAGRGAGPGTAVVVPGLVEPLSSREVEVLRLVAAGRQNREIAEELVVALSTVKKHVTHILDKLGAVNRTQATARARQLGLLP